MSIWGSIIGAIVGSKLDERKKALSNKLDVDSARTDDLWVKGRNEAYKNLLDGAGKSVVNQIEKKL